MRAINEVPFASATPTITEVATPATMAEAKPTIIALAMPIIIELAMPAIIAVAAAVFMPPAIAAVGTTVTPAISGRLNMIFTPAVIDWHEIAAVYSAALTAPARRSRGYHHTV